MKPQIRPIPQPDTLVVRLTLLADPAYESWSEARQAEDQADFDAWLCSPAGQAWLESEIAADEEQHGLSMWEGW